MGLGFFKDGRLVFIDEIIGDVLYVWVVSIRVEWVVIFV